jgi:hypothetical protein
MKVFFIRRLSHAVRYVWSAMILGHCTEGLQLRASEATASEQVVAERCQESGAGDREPGEPP